MKEKVSISIVTTCKGRLSYLKESLKSWLNLDYTNYEIIVVDYDDPDGTENYIKRNKNFLLENSKARDLKVVKVKNKPFFNLNDARNRGIKASDSELVFMVDSDIHIKDKNIFKKINRLYSNGIVFFSSQLILNTNYEEVVLLYKKYYDINLNIPLLLPIGTTIKGFNGTACFVKKLYSEIGGFNKKINESGYGQDENEFYLRYINHYFRNYFLKKWHHISLREALDRTLSDFYTFSVNSFVIEDNTEEEKYKFYPQELISSFEYNKKYIVDYFIKEKNSIQKSFSPTKRLINYENYSFNRVEGKNIPIWFKIQITSVLALYFSSNGQINKAILLNKKLLKWSKLISPNYKLNIYLSLANLYFKLGNYYYKNYYRRAITFLDKNEALIRGCSDLIRANIYFKLGNFKKSLEFLEKVIKKSDNPSDKAAVYFLMSQIMPEKEKYYKELAIKERKKKSYLKNLDLLKIAKQYFEIGKKKKAIEWAKKLLNRPYVPMENKLTGLLIIGDSYYDFDQDKAVSYYQEAVNLMKNKREKTPLNFQQMASLLKRIGNLKESKRLFKKLLKETKDNLLKASAYFHLGEIELSKNNKKRAVEYFKKCAGLNPMHKKAKEYIIKLTKEGCNE